MKTRQVQHNVKKQIRALLIGITFSLASAGVSDAMSDLISLSQEPVWPISSTPDGNLVYTVTTVGRGGSGLLLVNLSAGNMPPGVTVTFSPNVLRFTGNQLTAQTATMTVSVAGCPFPLDCYPFTLTGTAQRESITITNTVLFSADYVAVRPPTLYIDNLGSGNLRLRGLGATGKTYQIEACSDLGNPVWTSLGSATADGNGRFTFFTTQSSGGSGLAVIAGPSARFYRAVTTSGAFVCP